MYFVATEEDRVVSDNGENISITTVVKQSDIPPLDLNPNVDSTREYFVLVHDHDHLESLYADLETEGQAPSDTGIDRAVECVDRRPTSRATVYNLTDTEANLLLADDRVREVHLHPKYLGVRASSHVQQYSDRWSKGSSETNDDVNWGLLRCTSSTQIPGWGGEGYTGTGANTTPTVSATIELVQTGRNVDIINCDDYEIEWDHPEFYTNSDGTGTNRLRWINWYQWNPAVTGAAAGTYPAKYTAHNVTGHYSLGLLAYFSYHPTHVTGIMAGNTHGWARSANIYHIDFHAGASDSSAVFNYIREFHKNKTINPETGRRNPTIVNNSWGFNAGLIYWGDVTDVVYQGVTYQAPIYDGFAGGLYAWYGWSPGGPTMLQVTTWNRPEYFYQKVFSLGGSISSEGGPTTAPGNIIGTAGAIAAGYTASTTPTVGNNDNGYWTLPLPFPISLGESSSTSTYGQQGAPYNQYSTMYVGTNGYITFEAGSTINSGFSATNPPGVKIMFFAGDRSVQRIYYGTTGTSPNRQFFLRIEGNGTNTGTLGSPGIEIEIVFNETVGGSVPTYRFDFGQNNGRSREGTLLTYEFINSIGVVTNKTLPYRYPAVDSDVEDVIANGVILVGSAGNSSWKCDVPGGVDWNNQIAMQMKYPGEFFWLNRGQSPTANETRAAGGDYEMPQLSVGAIDSIEYDRKAQFSNTGPMINIWAPGTYIMSSYADYPGGRSLDPRNSSYFIHKISGTSMSAPQVTGVLACALEVYPNMTMAEATAYIQTYAKTSQITASSGGNQDYYDLQGSGNRFLYYYSEKKTTGFTFPKTNVKQRPASGKTWPRPRIRR